MKLFFIAAGIGFGVGMAILIGGNMSPQVATVIVAVAVGVIVSIPASLVIVSVVRKTSFASPIHSDPPRFDPPRQVVQQQAPPNVFVIDPSKFQQGEPARGGLRMGNDLIFNTMDTE